MINYLKSSISISSYNGCTINCKYCILSSLGNRENVRKVEDEKELVKKLLSLKLYSPEIPISVNNQTDPLLNKEIFNSTIKILKEMEKNEVPNPILIITKGYITEEQIKQIEKIDLNLIILYTFSGLSEKLENRNEKSQIETLKKLSKLQNCKLINYYRPVIEGINSDKETIEHIAKIVTKYCRASIVSGIRMNTHLKQIFEKNGITIPEKYDTDHKVLYPETYYKIKEIFKQTKKEYPVFKKTSCGVSYICGKPDYNGHSARIHYCNPNCISYPVCIGTNKIGFCNPDCPNFKVCKKESQKIITENEFKNLLKKIGKETNTFEIRENYIELHGTFWQEEVSYLRHICKKNIKADKLLKREDEFLLSL